MLGGRSALVSCRIRRASASARVVADDHVVVAGEVDVELERRDAEGQGRTERLEGVLGVQPGAAAVRLQVEGRHSWRLA